MTTQAFQPELVAVDALLAHPRNYHKHPDDQIEHLMQSLREHGFYRNVVVAKDNTILAGHGITQAAKKLGLDRVPVLRLNISPDSPEALKVLAGDNEILRLAEIDDRALTELLKEVKDTDVAGLLGTGYDEMMLAAALMVTRPASEIPDFDTAAEWVGMPSYEQGKRRIEIVIEFPNAAIRTEFIEMTKLKITSRAASGDMLRSKWPDATDRDLKSVKIE